MRSDCVSWFRVTTTPLVFTFLATAWPARADTPLILDFADPDAYAVSDSEIVEVADGLGQLVATVPVGDGSDGALTVTGTVDLSDYRSNGRSTPDIVTYHVVAIDGTDITVETVPAGISGGDEVLLISVQGTGDAHGNVGHHETLTVTSVEDSIVHVTSSVSGVYGAGEDNTDLSGQKVLLQRVPHYTTVTVASGGTLTTRAWDGSSGGLLVFRASTGIDVQEGGTIDMSRKGYRGGATTEQQGHWTSWTGESIAPSTQHLDNTNNFGGGGVGLGSCGEASGAGAYGTDGETVTQPSCSGSVAYHGEPGQAYGDVDLAGWFMGSGGGGGGRDDSSCEFSPGQPGGGLIVMTSPAITIDGTVAAAGGDATGGDASTCDDAIGGAGAGGMISLAATSLTLNGSLSAGGGDRTYISQANLYTGRGGQGRIRLDFGTVNGHANGSPEATSAVTAATLPYPGSVNNLSVYPDEPAYIESLEPLTPEHLHHWSGFDVETGPNHRGTLLFQLSTDQRVSWLWWDGQAWSRTSDETGAEASPASDIDAHVDTLEGDTLNVRVFLISDASQPVEIDTITVSYVVDPDQIDDDGDGFSETAGDCDDTDPDVFPGAPEDPNSTGYGDGIDNDCDGTVDESTLRYDDDGDGYAETEGDCDDQDPTLSPGAPETCDGVDNDCDGSVDNHPESGNTYYLDEDGDGYGATASYVVACAPPAGYVTDGSDCNDTQASIHPGATEICDDRDNDCDGTVDEEVTTTWYLDRDGDGYGDDSASTQSCALPSPYYSGEGGDCDDLKPSIHPGANEVCDGVDQDCDGTVDEDLLLKTYCTDSDGDGHGDPARSFESCLTTAPSGSADTCDDCDDTEATTYPDAPELCDGRDNDCDNLVDNDLEEVTYYADADGDGHGDPSQTTTTCTAAPEGFVLEGDDCDDDNDAIHPDADEVPYDGIDQDCDGADLTDVDQDGADALEAAGDDCDDNNPDVHPGASEVAYDGVDQDCDGADLDDLDGDGFTGQEAPDGNDCDDNDPDVHPGAEDICGNGVDEDCDGSDLACATPEPTGTPSPTPASTTTPTPGNTPTPGLEPTPGNTPTPGLEPTPTPGDMGVPGDDDVSPTAPAGDEAGGCSCASTPASTPSPGTLTWLLSGLALFWCRRRGFVSRRPTSCERNHSERPSGTHHTAPVPTSGRHPGYCGT